MRFSEFRLNEVVANPDGSIRRPGVDPAPAGNLEAGPPYPPEQSEAVKDLQRKLEELGYSVGSTGIDGKYGPRTSRAVAAYKRDFNVQDTDRGRSIDAREIQAMQNRQPVETPTPTGNEQGGSARYDLPPLADTSDIQGAVGEVLDFIGRYESAGHYDMLNGGRRNPRILDMTINEILRYQRTAPWPGGESSAIGRYQYVRATLEWVTGLMGVDRDTQTFDQDFQDRLCIYDMRYRCRLDQWLNGSIESEDFANRLAQVWSSIPTTSGRSAHHGIGSNRAGLSFNSAVAQLDQIKAGMA